MINTGYGKSVSELYQGTNKIASVYQGDRMVYSSKPPVFQIEVVIPADNTVISTSETAMYDSFRYDWTIDYGDGVSRTFKTNTFIKSQGGIDAADSLVHRYAKAGTYVITISSETGRMPFQAVAVDGPKTYRLAPYLTRILTPFLLLTHSSGSASDGTQIFYQCRKLYEVCDNILKYNPQVVGVGSLFNGSGLKSIPPNLFGKNKICDYHSVFYDCQELVQVPAKIFSNAAPKTNYIIFTSAFGECPKLEVVNDIFGDAYKQFKDVDVYFDRYMFRTTSNVTVPTLIDNIWEWTYKKVISTAAFGGAGNTVSTIQNYNSIPTGWK